MARNTNFDSGQAKLLPSIKVATALDIVHNRAEHELGFCQVDEFGNEQIYVRFGADGTQHDAFMFDETYGGNRSDSNGYSGTAENGARLITDGYSHGSIVGQVGILQYASAVKAGQFGFLQVKGWAIAKYRRSNSDDPLQGQVAKWSAGMVDGQISPASSGANDVEITGIAGGKVDHLTSAGTSEIKVFLTHPTVVINTTVTPATQPNFGRADEGWARLPQQDY